MSWSRYGALYLLLVPVFFMIDMLWLGVIARDFYLDELRQFLGPVNWPAAITFYLLYLGGIVFFAIAPALTSASGRIALLYGALFGFFTYATYDLTNLATLANWPLSVVIVDIIWGMTLSGSVALIGYFLARRLWFHD